MDNQQNKKQNTTTHQTLHDIMHIVVGSPDFENFGLASPHSVLHYGMKNAKDIAILMGKKDIKKNIEHLCNVVFY